MASLKVLGAGPVKRGITQLAAQFEKSSGHHVVVEFIGAPQSAMEEFVAQGRVSAETRMTLGRSRMGVAIALAGPLPDELQSITGYDAAVTKASANAAAAEFTKFLATPAARAAMATTGID